MTVDTLIEEVQDLPEESLQKLLEYIRFLKYELGIEKMKANGKKRNLGCLEGGLVYMADDFDETPDCFKEYM